ncbi:MAG: 50S ribosome-binding GTPase [Planctomycetota bacterium]|jgi:small GTP-binding protein|nr:50S ribosome-binding GTPase [Planctomycetota bacterium]
MARSDTLHFRLVTPPQTGAVAVFHLFGDEAEITAGLETRLRPRPSNPMKLNELRLSKLVVRDGDAVDEVLVAKPRDRMRIIMCHGGRRIIAKTAECLGSIGAKRIEDADPPFTRPDMREDPDALVFHALSKAHTRDQVIAILGECARGQAEGRLPDIQADWLRIRNAVFAGPPNAGKSSLMNCLAGFNRAFVHAEAGATRDVVEELSELAGRPVVLHDLPGFDDRGDELSARAIAKAKTRLDRADLVFFVADAAAGWNREHDAAAAALPAPAPVVVLLNKSDLPRRIMDTPWRAYFREKEVVATSALSAEATREAVSACAERIWGRLA